MPARRKKADDLCPEHFPDGWDGIDEQQNLVGARVNGVGCEHGTWTRTADAKPAAGFTRSDGATGNTDVEDD